MKPLLIFVTLGLSCGGPPPTRIIPCCNPTVVARDFGYVTTYSTDGGSPTRVQLIVTASGEARLSLVRDGNEVLQTFAAVPR